MIASVSGGALNRLKAVIELELASLNGQRGCDRLASGSAECSCDYCEAFWSRLERKLNGHDSDL